MRVSARRSLAPDPRRILRRPALPCCAPIVELEGPIRICGRASAARPRPARTPRTDRYALACQAIGHAREDRPRKRYSPMALDTQRAARTARRGRRTRAQSPLLPGGHNLLTTLDRRE